MVPVLHRRTERILLGLACLWDHLAADYMHTFTSEQALRESFTFQHSYWFLSAHMIIFFQLL